MKQSAVEWLEKQLQESGIPLLKDEIEFIEQAKEMEKQQQGYSEEEVFDLMNEYADDVMGGCNLRAKEWFEKFKNNKL